MEQNHPKAKENQKMKRKKKGLNLRMIREGGGKKRDMLWKKKMIK